MIRMKVFISYSSLDDLKAKQLEIELISSGMDYDMDKLHDNLPTQDAEELTETLHNAIKDCTHLVTVVSENTKHSVWVPYEIGFAVASKLGVATWGVGYWNMPGYLQIWPNFSEGDHIAGFIRYLKKEERILFEDNRLEKAAFNRESFYTKMKKMTGQMR